MKYLLLLTSFVLCAQTKLPIDQIKGPVGSIGLLAIDESGSLITVKLSDSVAIVDGTLVAKVNIAPTGYALMRSEAILTRNSDGSYILLGGETIYRNGLVQLEGPDYSRIDGRAVPNPLKPWASGDLVVGISHRIIIPSLSITRPL